MACMNGCVCVAVLVHVKKLSYLMLSCEQLTHSMCNLFLCVCHPQVCKCQVICLLF